MEREEPRLKVWLYRRLVKQARAWRRIVVSAVGAFGRGIALLSTGRREDRYGIRAFYLPRRRYVHFDVRTGTERPQDSVYEHLSCFAAGRRLASVLDVGCGTGLKLLKYFGGHETLGLERPPVLDHLRETYPERRWRLADFDDVPNGTFDIALSIDVIEHLLDPDELLRFLGRVDCRYVALSTPDRDRLTLQSRIGPPANVHHVREWSREELVRYVSRYFRVLDSQVVSGHEHLVVCEKEPG